MSQWVRYHSSRNMYPRFRKHANIIVYNCPAHSSSHSGAAFMNRFSPMKARQVSAASSALRVLHIFPRVTSKYISYISVQRCGYVQQWTRQTIPTPFRLVPLSQLSISQGVGTPIGRHGFDITSPLLVGTWNIMELATSFWSLQDGSLRMATSSNDPKVPFVSCPSILRPCRCQNHGHRAQSWACPLALAPMIG